MSRQSRSLSARARILGAMLLVATLGLVVVGSVTFLVQRDRVLAAIDARLDAQVQALEDVASRGASDAPNTSLLPKPEDSASSVVESIHANDFADVVTYLRVVVQRLVPGPNESSMAIIDGEPRWVPGTMVGFQVAENTEFIDRVVAETTAAGGAVRGTAATEQGTLRYIAVPVVVPGDAREGLYVRAVNLDHELAPVVTSMLTFSIAALATLVAVGIVGWFVAGRLLSPIRQLRETAESINLTDLSARIPVAGNDDVSDLARTVNSMLARLELSVDEQRHLLDDVRHELKTPITIVRGHLEVMDTNDADDVEATKEIGITELDRMSRLVDDIDLLAAVEGDQYAIGVVDVDELTARVGELVMVIPSHEWSVTGSGVGVVEADADRLVQAWLQLADNASKYTAPGSAIEIGSAVDARGAARLWVQDHGPGIAPAQRENIFRRFDRAGARRTVGGSGLGLAIVDAIARAHDGTCRVTDTPGGGATFTIHLPPPSVLMRPQSAVATAADAPPASKMQKRETDATAEPRTRAEMKVRS